MAETTEQYRARINQLKTSIENEPYMKDMRSDIAEGISKTGNRQADIEMRQDTLEDDFVAVQQDASAVSPSGAEVAVARGSYPTLDGRLTAEQNEVNAQLAQIVTNVEWFSSIAPEIDDTGRIQRALDSLPNGATLFFPPKTYTRGRVYLKDKKNVHVVGYGSIHMLSGVGASFEMQGEIENVTIEGFTIQGDGLVASKQSGFANASGTNFKNIEIIKNNIYDVSIGISINADLSGKIDGATISRNRVERVLGVNPGQGYGIHVSHGSYEPSSVLISDNTIIDAQRHSIYLARGNGFVVSLNKIKDHRKSASDRDTFHRSAIAISRTSNVSVTNNILQDCWSGMVGINPAEDNTEYMPSRNVFVSGNVFFRPKSIRCITVGYTSPETTDGIEVVSISNNTIFIEGNTIPAIYVYYGKKIAIDGNIINIINNPSVTRAIELSAVGGAEYCDGYFIKNNVINVESTTGVPSQAFRINTSLATISCKTEFKDNNVSPNGTPFSGQANILNPKLFVSGHSTEGLVFEPGNNMLANNTGPLKVSDGFSGTFATTDGKVVTITNGIVTKVD